MVHKKSLISAILFTVVFHIAAIFWVKDFSWTTTSWMPEKQKHIAEDHLEIALKTKKKRNQELEHIFSRLTAKPVLPSDVQFDFKSLDTSVFPQALNQYDITSLEHMDDQKTSLILNREEYTLSQEWHSLSMDMPDATEDFFNPLEDSYEEPINISRERFLENQNVFAQSSLIDVVNSSKESVALQQPLLASTDVQHLDIENIDNIKSVASSSDFLVNVEYAPQKNADGFVFKVALRPKPHKCFKRIKQNIYFLIDRSHSIPVKYYQAAKEAVSASLDFLHEDDTFNVLIFDGKVVKLSAKNMLANPKNIKAAKQFLKNQKHGGFFATTDLYSSLDKIVPETVKDNEVHIAILLSDGDTYIQKQKKRKTIHYWSQKNNGKISLFSLAIGKNHNIALLDVLSTFNKGFSKAAFDPEGIQPQLLGMVQSLRSPIGKDLTVTGLPHHSHASLSFFPSQQHLPHLYENLEYVLYGTIDQASDFTLFLQGRYYDEWLDIKKSISLTRGTRVDGETLQKGLILQKAYAEYEQYLRSGHPEFLEKAKSLLEPVNLPMAFD